ncbi:MAG: YihY family inner membrane protein, partial [Nitrospirae bacterium]
YKRLVRFFSDELWRIDLTEGKRLRRFSVKAFRLFYLAFKELTYGQLNYRAMGLVYTTILSIVPLLAVTFSVLKAFGVYNIMTPILLNIFAPLGDKGEEITVRIIEFVDRLKVGVLGALGLGLLIYTVVSLIQKIEDAFNYIWSVKRPRSLARRFSDYMSVILIGPVLIFSAMGVTASVMSTSLMKRLEHIEPFGTIILYSGKVIPYLLVCGAFTFAYIFIPNVKVRFKSALVGGLVAGIMWETTGWFFASFVAGSTKYTAIYSSFAILILFFIWIYLSWLILLVGAVITYYHQYPQLLGVKKELLMISNRLKERLGFVIMYLIAYNFHNNLHCWSIDSLVQRLNLPLPPVQDVITLLEKGGLLIETGDDPPCYLPARDIERIRLVDILDVVRMAGEETMSIEQKHLSLTEVNPVVDGIDRRVREFLGERTLRDLVVTKED